jgi:hypothetical protein
LIVQSHPETGRRWENPSDLQLKNKTAIVTGGSAGIGLAISKALAAEGITDAVAVCSKEKSSPWRM